MKTIKTLVYTGVSSLTVAVFAPSIGMAEVNKAVAATESGSHSLVHRVSHSLADSESYTSNGPSGYKWGRKVEQNDAKVDWAGSTHARSGYKWGDEATSGAKVQAYANNASYQWGVRSYADQTGYRWGLKNFADQTGYRWGLKNFADQTGYRWGLKSFADQTGYRWGLK